MELLARLTRQHQQLGVGAPCRYSVSSTKPVAYFVRSLHFTSDSTLVANVPLRSLWHWGPFLGGRTDRFYGVTAFADPSSRILEEKVGAVPEGLPRAQKQGRKPRQSIPQSGKPASPSKSSGDVDSLTDAGSESELLSREEKDNQRPAGVGKIADSRQPGVEGKDGTQTKRALKAMLGAYQRRGLRQYQEADDAREEDEESGGTEESEEEDGAPGGAFGRMRKPRKRLLSEEDWELRRAYVAVKLGLDAEESLIVNSSIPAQITIPPLEERLNALFALGLDSYEIVLAIMRYPGILSIRRFHYYGPNVQFVHSLGIKKEDLPTIILRFPRLLVLKMEEIDSTVAYIRSLGLGDEDIRKMVLACPIIICKDVETVMVPRVQVFQAFGMPPDRIACMIRKVPGILALFSPSRLAANLMYLEELGMSRDEIILLTSRNPEVIGHSIKDNLEPKIDWLKSLGMTQLDAARVVLGKPKLSLLKLQSRIRDLLEYGFTLEQVMKMLLRNQGLIGFARETLYAKLSFIENVMGQSKEEISEWPTSLCYSLERRMIPRWEEAVQAGIQHTTNWRTLIVATRERFEIMKLKRTYSRKARRKSDS